MSKIDRFTGDEPEALSPEELVTQTFSRCQNWPKDRLGIIGLAQGLRRASDQMRIAIELIVGHCATNSPYCPTDADLFTAARVLRESADRTAEAAKNKADELRKQYGPPKPWKPEPVDAPREDSYQKRHAAMMLHIGRHLKVEGHDWRNVNWTDIRAAAKELGYTWDTAERAA